MMYSEFTTTLFQSVYEKLKPFHSLIESYPAVIAYSGGKDSTLLSSFYHYLHSNSKCPEPILFHLNHLIRNNVSQEEEIILEMKTFSTRTIVKKKTFRKFLNELRKA
ncbi:MAG: hypothetical protein KBA66_25180 [Leptospiraceae bacterium]|nr:hypothetical protein [Leptospiraceae bacterium]